MEIRKPGAAELKPALALAWDVFLKDAASGFSDEGIRTFKRFIEYDGMATTLANGTTTMWAAFSGLEPIGVIAARESHICLFFVAGPHQRQGVPTARLRPHGRRAGCRRHPVRTDEAYIVRI